MNRLTRITCFLLVLLPLTALADARTERQKNRLQTTIMNANLPLAYRINALRELHADEFVNGRIDRSFCVWDPLGRAGPIFATVSDQTVRSLHYGIALDVRAYQDEELLLTDLKERRCDAALLRGNRVYEFNRFAATVEAVGAVPDLTHLKILMQVVANSRTAPRLEENGFTVLGIASLGENYLFAADSKASDVDAFRDQPLAVVAHDESLQAIAQQFSSETNVLIMPELIQGFTGGTIPVMMAPLAVYPVMAGQLSSPISIFAYPVAQSTVHLVGHSDRFPTGLAQLLREDFLFMFDAYQRRVEQERSAIPATSWKVVNTESREQFDREWSALRDELLHKGLYDESMLTLQKRVRCRLAPNAQECQS